LIKQYSNLTVKQSDYNESEMIFKTLDLVSRILILDIQKLWDKAIVEEEFVMFVFLFKQI
jgi:hypothetical protein